jgi:hypothetical protein
MASSTYSRHNNSIPLVAFAISTLISVSLFIVPAFIIRPFKFQAPRSLLWALAVKHQAPLWTLLFAIATSILAVALWSRVSSLGRALMAVGVFLTIGAAVMSRVDYFEWMFHPIASAGYEPAASVKLDSSEMVMAVNISNDARAYPIREMAYHHVLNDYAGGVPIAVTY